MLSPDSWAIYYVWCHSLTYAVVVSVVGYVSLIGCIGKRKPHEERDLQIKQLPSVDPPDAEEDARKRHEHHVAQQLPTSIVVGEEQRFIIPKHPPPHPAVAPEFIPVDWKAKTGSSKPPRCTIMAEADTYVVPGLNGDRCRGATEDDEETDPALPSPSNSSTSTQSSNSQ